ncbi:hypothetical protein PYW07_002465 [Mythimna separata]|uniref:Uncharacterized protein n=1 Tax=Mythimna separata TaxID=271217 RepID=A0AAD8DTG1_MYTSE|nr:hypothetical protein PYW07_002465 [Mythimna separata]
MQVACYLMSVFYVVVQCQVTLPPYRSKNEQIHHCVVGILNKYFTERQEFSYVNMDTDDEELLKTIHSTQNFSLLMRSTTHQSEIPNQGYLINSKNVPTFIQYFEYLMTDPTWNPYARFLIIVESLQNDELRVIFDELLRLHVSNVVILNGTDDAHLFTYNPFENYACGKYYNDVISFGLCSQTTQDLYPNKLVTGLKNCTFKASLAHRPPFGINPLRSDGKKTMLGTEEYILKVLSEMEQFTVISNYSYDADIYSSVAPNMSVSGPMQMLRNNESDVIFGGMIMVTTRAQAFTWLCGYHDFNDELRFTVKRASLAPIWKTVYIEFDAAVWLLLLLAYIVYCAMMIFLLQAKDKGFVALELLENLLLHSRDIRCSMSIKYILIIWVWFAYLINTFYQSSLVSLTTDPSLEYQVQTEDDLLTYKYRPCFSVALRKYLATEPREDSPNKPTVVPLDADEIDGCSTTIQALLTVSQTKDLYTIVPYYLFLYNKRLLHDKWGNSLMYYFRKPYMKFLFGFYFYKGFPITHQLQLNTLRLRENGLADKSLHDQYFSRLLKQRFSQKEFEVRFTVPWCVYAVGCAISTVTFIIEYLSKR